MEGLARASPLLASGEFLPTRGKGERETKPLQNGLAACQPESTRLMYAAEREHLHGKSSTAEMPKQV